MWIWKYCYENVNDDLKDWHRQTKEHKFNKKWYYYYAIYDVWMKEIGDDFKSGIISWDKYEIQEKEILDTLEELMKEGIFDNKPDEE